MSGKGEIRTGEKKSRNLSSRFPDRFTEDLDSNKKVVETLTNVSYIKLRNRIAG